MPSGCFEGIGANIARTGSAYIMTVNIKGATQAARFAVNK